MKPELIFVSPRFLFPAHSGGAIRTGQILRGLKGGRFRVTLLSPATAADVHRFEDELGAVADEFAFWTAANSEDRGRLSKALHLFSNLPISVAADSVAEGRAVIAAAVARRPAVVVADFAHSAVLFPDRLDVPSVMFTHNVEAEIYERHAERAEDWWMRLLWHDQSRKMRRYEGAVLRRFDTVIAVAERDAARFLREYGVRKVETIPTGVDLDYFRWEPPDGSKRVVFTGSMDGLANVEGIEWMMREVWPRVVDAVPEAEMNVVGKAPPERLISRAQRLPGWRFVGRVPDIRPYLAGADACVIPLRIGGGTRIKAFEAMAAGAPVVSTTLGVEGLGVVPNEHLLCADDADAFGVALVELLRDPSLGVRLSRQARAHVDAHCSNQAVAQLFETICERTASRSTADDNVVASATEAFAGRS